MCGINPQTQHLRELQVSKNRARGAAESQRQRWGKAALRVQTQCPKAENRDNTRESRGAVSLKGCKNCVSSESAFWEDNRFRSHAERPHLQQRCSPRRRGETAGGGQTCRKKRRVLQKRNTGERLNFFLSLYRYVNILSFLKGY